MFETAIKVKNVTKTFKSVLALSDVSFEIKRGSITGLVGKNGAGKTTLIKILTGVIKADQGHCELLGGAERKSTSVAAIVEKPALYLSLNAKDNLITQCKLLDIPEDKTYLENVLRSVGLDPASRLLVKNYSLGMKQRLAIALALVGKPEILILDEPTNGLDPQGIHEIRELLAMLNRKYGMTMLISSHILSELSKIATDYVFIENGKVLKTISATELTAESGTRLRIVASDAEKACEVLGKFGKTAVTQEGAVELFADVPTSTVVMELAREEIAVHSINTASDDLENFYLRLTHGKTQASEEVKHE